MGESLKKKTVKGVAWSAIDTIGNYGITFIVGIVLARLLSPEEYGLIGIVTVFTAVFNNIVEGGFSSALIRKNDISQADYCTMFYVNLSVSIVLSLILFGCSGLIADFFGRKELVELTRSLSPIIILNGLGFVQRTHLTKNLDFKSQTKVSIVASISSGVVGISMAYMGFGVWSLVGQQLSRQGLNTLMLWIVSRWRPLLLFSKESFKNLFGFGWKLLVSNLLDTVWKEINQVVIGKVYSPQMLGYYTRASQYGTVVSSSLTSIIQKVSYPVLSSIQSEKGRMKGAYRRVIRLSMMLTSMIMLCLAACAKSFIVVLIGEKWLPCVPMLQILCLGMMLYPLHSINLNMLQVLGRSDIYLILEIVKKVIGIIPILLGIFVGVYSLLVGGVIVGVISYFLNSFYSGKGLEYSSLDQLRDIIPSLMISFATALLVWSVTLLSLSPIVELVVQIILGIIVGVALHEIFKLSEYVEFKGIVVDLLHGNH